MLMEVFCSSLGSGSGSTGRVVAKDFDLAVAWMVSILRSTHNPQEAVAA